MALDMQNSERISPRQREIRGRFLEGSATLALSMVWDAGEVIAEIWITVDSLPRVIEWLEFAQGKLDGMDNE